jgi:hypothetical protein
MDELIRRFIENGFADFEGMHITGTIPVRQETVNEVIAAVLKGEIPIPGAEGGSSGTGGTGGGGRPKPKLPLPDLLKLVQRAEVQADNGRIIVNFEVRR